MLLPDHHIARRAAGNLTITPYRPENLQPASYDLTLGEHLLFPDASDDRPLDPAGPDGVRPHHMRARQLAPHGYILKPGNFVLAETAETLHLPPDLAARVEGKSSLGRLGLVVHLTAGFIDPGFYGVITLEIANLNPIHSIVLRPGMPIAQAAFTGLSAPAQHVYGERGNHYQHQVRATESRAGQPPRTPVATP